VRTGLQVGLDDGSSEELAGAEIAALSAALWGLAPSTLEALACIAQVDYARHTFSRAAQRVDLSARESAAFRTALAAVRGE
jgi:hypothetical protein